MFDIDTLRMALLGCESEHRRVQAAIVAIHSQLGVRSESASAYVMTTPTTEFGPVKRQLSASARKRISVAQKKRWTAFRMAKDT